MKVAVQLVDLSGFIILCDLAVCAISFAIVAARVVYSMRFLSFVEGCVGACSKCDETSRESRK
jgi:hypothetical protein